MKHDIYYTLRRQSPWVTVSGALMGLAFLIQAVYFLLIRNVTQVLLPELMIYMAIPMAVEFLWCLMIHVIPQRDTVALGITACLIFVVLMGLSLFYGDLARTILAVAAYLAVAQLVMLIMAGRFPYRLVGFAAVALTLLVRILAYSVPVYVKAADWTGLLVRELPGLCMLAAIMCVLAVIQPHKKEATEE